jgi:hypothetical protein
MGKKFAKEERQQLAVQDDKALNRSLIYLIIDY